MKLRPCDKQVLWWAVSKHRWRPVWNGTRVEWKIVAPRYFTAHDVAIEFGGKVKWRNVLLKDLTDTGYLSRIYYKEGRWSDIRANRQKQRVYSRPGKDGTYGHYVAGKRRRRPCYWHYLPVEEALVRFFKEFGISIALVDRHRLIYKPRQKNNG